MLLHIAHEYISFLTLCINNATVCYEIMSNGMKKRKRQGNGKMFIKCFPLAYFFNENKSQVS